MVKAVRKKHDKGEAEYSVLRLTAIDLTLHVVVTFFIAWFFYCLTGGWLWPLLSVLGGILIDVDHILDYLRYFGSRLSVSDFFKHKYLESGKVYVFFHSWELLILIWILSARISFLVPLATGITGHLIIDQFFIHISHHPFFYFLSYRWRQGFDLEKLNPEAHHHYIARKRGK